MPRRPIVIAVASAGLLGILTALVAARVAPVVRMDATISAAATGFALRHPAWRHVALAVTTSGGPAPTTVASVAAVLILAAVGRVRAAAFAAVTMLGSTVARRLVLYAVARPRSVGWLAPASGFSFPSGHTTESAAAALTALALCWPLVHGYRRRLAATAVGLWAVSVGVSRVVLVVHWPTDVLAGWLLAIAVVAAAQAVLPPSRWAAQLDHGGDRSRRERDEDRQRGESVTAKLRRKTAQRRRWPSDDSTVDAP